MSSGEAIECVCAGLVDADGSPVHDPACPVLHEKQPPAKLTPMQEWCNKMEATINWLRQFPNWEPPDSFDMVVYPLIKNRLASMVREAGACKKSYSDNGLTVVWEPEGCFPYKAYISRNAVCRKVETGETRVEIPAIKAEPARVECRKQYKWVCNEPLLAATERE